MPTDVSPQPHLSGLLAPVQDERSDRHLEVQGELPAGLRGMFVRNGPNPQLTPLDGYLPFDGDGMVHAVYFEDGEAHYRNRWVESKGLLAERKRGRALFGGLGAFRMPDADVMAEVGVLKNTGNTHTIRHADRVLALMEAGPPTELTRDLDTVGEYDFGGRLDGPVTAHPKIDPVNGELHFFGYAPFPPFLRYHVADASGALVHSTEIDLPSPVMMHDFAVTEHYVLFVDSPAIFDIEGSLAGGPPVRWDADQATRLGVLPRGASGDRIRWFEVEPCYLVHTYNAWDDGDRIELRAPRFSGLPGGFQFDDPAPNEPPMPWRWSIDLAAGTVTDEQTDDRSGEFPRVNDDLATRPTRYLYNGRTRSWADAYGFDFHSVAKYDLEADTAVEHVYGETEVSGEHVFAPDPDGTAEDDGWLLGFVTDRITEQTDLVVLDARDVTGDPLARVRMPRRVPIGFHANWFAEG
ncbi:MAG: carotenoid oxygenase family protein [Acidimicrobiales bacterium]